MLVRCSAQLCLGADDHHLPTQTCISPLLETLTCREGDGAELHPVEVAPDPPVLHHGVAHRLIVLDVSCKGRAGAQPPQAWLLKLTLSAGFAVPCRSGKWERGRDGATSGGHTVGSQSCWQGQHCGGSGYRELVGMETLGWTHTAHIFFLPQVHWRDVPRYPNITGVLMPQRTQR